MPDESPCRVGVEHFRSHAAFPAGLTIAGAGVGVENERQTQPGPDIGNMVVAGIRRHSFRSHKSAGLGNKVRLALHHAHRC